MNKEGMQRLIMEQGARKTSQGNSFTLDGRMHASSSNSDNSATINAVLESERKKAFDQGYNEGLAKVQAEWEKKSSLLNHMIEEAHQLFRDVDNEIETKLLEISVAIAKQVVRRELTLDSEQIVSTVKKALELIPNSEHEITVYINPADEDSINEVFSQYIDSERFKIFVDPTISIGGCKVGTDYSLVDLTVDSKIASIAASFLSDQRTDNNE